MFSNSPKLPQLPTRFAEISGSLDSLARQAVDGISFAHERSDPMFGGFGQVAGFVRSAVCVEGHVLETGLRIILDHCGAFSLLPPEFRLPVIAAAKAAVRSNDKEALVALRLDPKVYTNEYYTPDIVAVHRQTGAAFLLELKRTTSSYPRPILERLEEKMVAAALVTRDAALAARRHQVVSRVQVAIVDCSNNDKRDHVIDLDGLDLLLDQPGIGASLKHLRHRFAVHVQKALGALIPAGESRENTAPVSPSDRDEHMAADEDGPMAPGLVAVNFARRRDFTNAPI
ncbi:hypothetical protein [Pelagibacterium montanilacus]|uniref:hypothetical protein n=1 Tax=Pelagibacterium montanilacus TaxID=2185280 RepID=UPI000F8E46DC|nr:hypothetical protein [Pelagibacterium montanilacus]